MEKIREGKANQPSAYKTTGDMLYSKTGGLVFPSQKNTANPSLLRSWLNNFYTKIIPTIQIREF